MGRARERCLSDMNGTRGGRSIGVESGSTVVEFILGKCLFFVFFFIGFGWRIEEN